MECFAFLTIQIIRNHKEYGGFLYPFDESLATLASALDIGLRLFGSNKNLVPELSSWGNMKGLV